MAENRPRYALAELMLVVALCGLLLGFFETMRSGTLLRNFLPTFLLFEVGFMGWAVAWHRLRGRRTARVCEDCGRSFIPAKASDPSALCPRCRVRGMSPAQLKAQNFKVKLWLAVFGACLSMVAAVSLSDFVAGHFRRGYWVALLTLSVASAVGILVALFAVLVGVRVLRYRSLRGERSAIAAATASAGAPGVVSRSGPLTVWSSAGDEFLAVVTDQFEDARRRFESLAGGPVECRHTVRFLCFGTRSMLVAFYRRFGFEVGGLDGCYSQSPVRTAALFVEPLAYRLTDTERTTRMLAGFYLLETYKGFVPPVWLQQGVAKFTVGSGGGDGQDFYRINRKILATLARGSTLPADDLFRANAGTLAKLVRAGNGHAAVIKLALFNAQSASLVEYLGGARATVERRERFRAFLKGLRSRKTQEQDFERHFGHGFDRLLAEWREWVVGLGLGTFGPPPPAHRDALIGRLVPTIRDPGVKLVERVQAVRSMGQWGYTTGADSLIDLLRDGTDVPREDVVWSLEMISGSAFGDDPGRWSDWWRGLPERAVPAGVTPEG